MPASTTSRRLARFNRKVGNRIVGRGLSMMPGFGAIVHRGRKSGRQYRTPVKIFRTDHGYLIALPYGPESDWVRNVLAAGGCELLTRDRRIRLEEPRVFTASSQAELVQAKIPAPLRTMLAWFGVTGFIEMRLAPQSVADKVARDAT
jgi:deazaflavin-dependent oxidoreductase (nitroreductase family)